MTSMEFSHQLIKCVLATALANVSLISWFTSVQAQTPPPKPPDKSAPGSQADSGTRGPCDSDVPSTANVNEDQRVNKLVALVPAFEKPTNGNLASTLPETDVWGQTTSPHPTFWFYLPAAATFAKSAEFVLEDEENYRSVFRFTPPTTPGMISLPIPSTEIPLQTGKRYHWSLNIYCDLQKSPPPRFSVDGWITRIELNSTLKSQIEAEKSPERIILYAQQGIWFERLTELANLHRTHSQNTADTWTELLGFIGWKRLAKQPILPCCTLEKQ